MITQNVILNLSLFVLSPMLFSSSVIWRLVLRPWTQCLVGKLGKVCPVYQPQCKNVIMQNSETLLVWQQHNLKLHKRPHVRNRKAVILIERWRVWWRTRMQWILPWFRWRDLLSHAGKGSRMSINGLCRSNACRRSTSVNSLFYASNSKCKMTRRHFKLWEHKLERGLLIKSFYTYFSNIKIVASHLISPVVLLTEY